MLLFHFPFMLSYIKATTCWALHFVGVADSEEHRENFPSQYFPDINYSFVPSISVDTIRDNLYVVTFDTTTRMGSLRQNKYFVLKFSI